MFIFVILFKFNVVSVLCVCINGFYDFIKLVFNSDCYILNCFFIYDDIWNVIVFIGYIIYVILN